FEPLRKEIRIYHKQSVTDVISDIRSGYIKGLLRSCYRQTGKTRRQWTELIDSVVLNSFLGIPLFFLMMFVMFRFTFEGSAPFVDWADSFFTSFAGRYIDAGLSAAGAVDWVRSLVGDGIVGGVGAVLSFVPLMVFLYFFLGLLEESGYMARAAFVMDRVMRSVGLPGKAFVPLLIGFGCNVPAIYASRTLDNEKERKLTAILTPFMSCAARLPVYALFTAVFFKESATRVIFGLYAVGILVAVIIGFLYKKFFTHGEEMPLIMELPPYRIPTGKMLWNAIFLRTKSFVRKAGTLILVTMVILWVMMNLPYGTDVEKTVLGRGARLITPVFQLNGFGKVEPVAALIPGIVAKEVVVGALGQIYHTNKESPGEEDKPLRPLEDLGREMRGLGVAALDSVKGIFGIRALSAFDLPEEDNTGLGQQIEKDFTPLSALSYMVFILLFVPCVAVLAAIKHEFGWKMFFYVLLLTLIVPWLASLLVYQGGVLIGWG
ncbi:MAG TPA: ferrous iron transport protein B, partial [Firmicutes bacterium]|nr:ferrous iron transport protein B [Bacillota bacterium]